MEKLLEDLMPVLDSAEGCLLSRHGDMTLGFKVVLPEIFTLSDQQYEAFHQTWVKALRMLPNGSVFHKQDWFVKQRHRADFEKTNSFLSHSSERFFNERPFLDHHCYVFISRKPAGRKPSSSLVSSLLKPGLFPRESLSEQVLQEFRGQAGQFKRIMEDSGFVKMHPLNEKQMLSSQKEAGLIERYCYLNAEPSARLVKDISFESGIKIGDQYCQLYSLADAADLPAFAARESITRSIQVTKPSSVPVLPAALGSFCPATIFITS